MAQLRFRAFRLSPRGAKQSVSWVVLWVILDSAGDTVFDDVLR